MTFDCHLSLKYSKDLVCWKILILFAKLISYLVFCKLGLRKRIGCKGHCQSQFGVHGFGFCFDGFVPVLISLADIG